jgi:hypothetical protein
MQRGTNIHGEIEHYLRSGKIRMTEWSLYVEAAKEHLPKPKDPDVIIEQRIDLDCGAAVPGVAWLGFIDAGDSGRDPLRLLDYKTTSDFRYAKTPHELSQNTQLCSYAKWAYGMGHTGNIELAHLYLKTQKTVPKKLPKTKLVTIKVNKDMIEDIWQRDLGTVAQMADAHKASSAQDLPPTTSACMMYGGCTYRSQCGLTASDFSSNFRNTTKGTKDKTMSKFLERLRGKKGNGATKPTGILPDDAPSRETPVAETEAETEAVADTAAEAKPPKAKRGRPKGSTKKKSAPASDGFTLYIDCIPTKDAEPTLFEDWLGPIVMNLNETVQAEKNLPDYRLLPYAEEKAMFALALSERAGDLPPTMIVNSTSPGARDALGVLIPHASQVVRALRG